MPGISVTMTKSKDLDIIGIYRSQEGDINDLIGVLDTLIDKTRATIIGGDINVCVSKAPNNLVTRTLKERGYLQIVMTATHIEGGVLDHVYINTYGGELSWDIAVFPKYYSDHDGIGLTLWTENQDKGKQLYFN